MVRIVQLSYVLSLLRISLENKQAILTLYCSGFYSIVWLFSCHFTTTFIYYPNYYTMTFDGIICFSISPREFNAYVRV